MFCDNPFGDDDYISLIWWLYFSEYTNRTEQWNQYVAAFQGWNFARTCSFLSARIICKNEIRNPKNSSKKEAYPKKIGKCKKEDRSRQYLDYISTKKLLNSNIATNIKICQLWFTNCRRPSE